MDLDLDCRLLSFEAITDQVEDLLVDPVEHNIEIEVEDDGWSTCHLLEPNNQLEAPRLPLDLVPVTRRLDLQVEVLQLEVEHVEVLLVKLLEVDLALQFDLQD